MENRAVGTGCVLSPLRAITYSKVEQGNGRHHSSRHLNWDQNTAVHRYPFHCDTPSNKRRLKPRPSQTNLRTNNRRVRSVGPNPLLAGCTVSSLIFAIEEYDVSDST